MTQFIDLRVQPVGGGLAATPAVYQGTSLSDYAPMRLSDLLNAMHGRDVLIAAHGFNVDRADGIACLSNWAGLLQLPRNAAFIGLLWPGDSVWAHGLDYPDEPKIADEAGALLAKFLDANFQSAASISFASHSLGARVVLETISQMSRRVRRLTLMAPAIDDNCLRTEFQALASADKVESISVLASKKDSVLSMAFPLGNFLAGILAAGHPWWRAALGNCGPAAPWPSNFQAPFELPDDWKFVHGNYLQIDQPQPGALPLPVNVPPQSTPPPTGNGWQEAFSSAFVSTRFL
jgi:pimeloyl-ACP methyl ester carboxylesterase